MLCQPHSFLSLSLTASVAQALFFIAFVKPNVASGQVNLGFTTLYVGECEDCVQWETQCESYDALGTCIGPSQHCKLYSCVSELGMQVQRLLLLTVLLYHLCYCNPLLLQPSSAALCAALCAAVCAAVSALLLCLQPHCLHCDCNYPSGLI